MNSIDVIKTELRSLLKPIIGVIVIFTGGLVPAYIYFRTILPLTSLFVFMLICAVFIEGLLCWRIAKRAKHTSWFDREYDLVSIKWSFDLSADHEFIDGICTSERKLKCIEGEVPHIAIVFNKIDDLFPFDGKTKRYPKLLDSYRDGTGSVSIDPPHKTKGTSYGFRICFHPPLKPKESAYVKYQYEIPRYTAATLEKLRSSMQMAVLDARDFSYNSYAVSYPIKKYIHQVDFEQRCGITPIGIEVKRRTLPFPSEYEFITKNELFTVESKENGGYSMCLKRKFPPMNAGYRIKWKPPRVDELSNLLNMKAKNL